MVRARPKFLHEEATWIVKLYARREWNEYRRENEWNENDHELTTERMEHIRDWVARRATQGVEEVAFPGHYELGHKFVVEHIVDSLRKNPKLKLWGSDVERLRTLLGARNYNITGDRAKKERLKMADAAMRIHEVQTTNRQELFEALRKELLDLDEKVRNMNRIEYTKGEIPDIRHSLNPGTSYTNADKKYAQTDIFANAVGNVITRRVKRANNFKELADALEDLARG